MKTVLFVCAGNVGRSQVAEAYFNHFSKADRAISAGTEDHGREEISKDMRSMLEEEHVSTLGQKPKLLTDRMVKSADRIIVMCSSSQCPTYLLESGKAEFWEISDPKDKDLGFKKSIKEQIKSKVLELLERLEFST